MWNCFFLLILWYPMKLFIECCCGAWTIKCAHWFVYFLKFFFRIASCSSFIFWKREYSKRKINQRHEFPTTTASKWFVITVHSSLLSLPSLTQTCERNLVLYWCVHIKRWKSPVNNRQYWNACCQLLIRIRLYFMLGIPSSHYFILLVFVWLKIKHFRCKFLAKKFLLF